MIKKLSLSSMICVLLFAFSGQTNADFVTMDFVSGINTNVTRSIVDGGFTGSDATVDDTNPNFIAFTTNHTGASRTGSVRYDFNNGLNDFLGGLTYSQSSSKVRFEVAMRTDLEFGHGDFAITARYFESGAGVGTVFGSTLVNPNSGGARIIMETNVTMADLQTTDIDAVEWTIAYTGGNTAGLTSSLVFGNNNGLIAAPEPTSAAMIGCALIGLVAGRRRRA
jgi:hypothetical protein